MGTAVIIASSDTHLLRKGYQAITREMFRLKLALMYG